MILVDYYAFYSPIQMLKSLLIYTDKTVFFIA
jgi:hypothetical protein